MDLYIVNPNRLSDILAAAVLKKQGVLNDNQIFFGTLFDYIDYIQSSNNLVDNRLIFLSFFRKTPAVLKKLDILKEQAKEVVIIPDGFYNEKIRQVYPEFDLLNRSFRGEDDSDIDAIYCGALKEFYKVLGSSGTFKLLSSNNSKMLDWLLKQSIDTFKSNYTSNYPIFFKMFNGKKVVLLDRDNTYYSYSHLLKALYKGSGTVPSIILSPVESKEKVLIFVTYLDKNAKINPNDLPNGVQYIVRKGLEDYLILPNVSLPEIIKQILS